MQNTVEASNKFEKFLMPIFSNLSVENRMVSNYRMLLNKEITNENSYEIKNRINQYTQQLLEIIAYNLHKTDENPENCLNFVNRRHITKEFDMKKIEILFPKHYEMILKNSKSNCFRDDELAELDDLEAQIFAYIRLGNDCENYIKNSNNKKCVAKIKNFNGLINNPINNNNNSNSKILFEETTSMPNFNISNSSNNTNNFKLNNFFAPNNINKNIINNNPNNPNNPNSINNNLNDNFKNYLECKIKIQESHSNSSSDPNFKLNSVAVLDKYNNNSMREFSCSQTQSFSISEENKIKTNAKERKINSSNKSIKKPNNESKNIFFEVIQANNTNNTNLTSAFIGKENNNTIKIEKNSKKEPLKRSRKNLILNANETLTHFLKEKNSEVKKIYKKKNLVNSALYNTNCSFTALNNHNQEDIGFNSLNYNNKITDDDYYKTACEVESYLNSDNLEIKSIENTNININYFSNVNTFIDKSHAGRLPPLAETGPNTNVSLVTENIADFVMFVENQKESNDYNPLAVIFKENKQDLNNLNNLNNKSANSLTENSKHKTYRIRNDSYCVKTNRLLNNAQNENNNNNNYAQNKDSDINCNQSASAAFTNNEIFFEKNNNNNNNNDSTGGDFDREMNSLNEFSHMSSEISTTNVKKEKYKSKIQANDKLFEEQIQRDPNSNYNYYSRQYIPKSNKKSEKFKNMIPFLRDFNPKFLKKENIDKKILRKFRNFVKSFMENNELSGKIYSRLNSMDEMKKAICLEFEKFKDFIFLKKFYKQNLLPPMSFCDDSNNICIEFKSFNTNYMLWLFSQDGVSEVYKLFTDSFGNEILNDFVLSYNLEFVNKKSEAGIIQTLKDYIFSIEKIYTTASNSKMKMISKKKSTAELSLFVNNHPTLTSSGSVSEKNEYSLSNDNRLTTAINNRKNMISAANNQKQNSSLLLQRQQHKQLHKRIGIDFEIVYQKNRSNTMTSEDIFDKCIDDLEIKNQAMILDFYNSKKEENEKQLAGINLTTTNKDLCLKTEPFKIWNCENNEHPGNLNNGKKLVGKFVNEDQMYFEGLNNQQLENLNYFY